MKSVITAIQSYYVFLIIARLMGWDIPQEKTVEVRKDYPKDPAWNKITHIYCSKNRKSFNRIPAQYQPFMAMLLGKVIGEFVSDRITRYESEFCDDETYERIQEVYEPDDFVEYGEYAHETIADNETNRGDNQLCKDSCLTWEELRAYIGNGIKEFYGWHISDLKIYDKPKELGEFSKPYGTIIRAFDSPFITCPPQSWCYVEGL